MPMRVRNISKIVLYYVKIHRKHLGKTIVVHNLNCFIKLMTLYILVTITANHIPRTRHSLVLSYRTKPASRRIGGL